MGELIARGYSVATVDWRGQGLSDRLLADPRKGHVDDFASFDADLDAFMAEVVPALPKPSVLAKSEAPSPLPPVHPAAQTAVPTAPRTETPPTGAHAPDEFFVIESANPKINGMDDAAYAFIAYLYQLAAMG